MRELHARIIDPMKIKAALLALSVVLSSCGGGGSDQPSQHQISVSIDAIGDSTMFGTTVVAGRVERAAFPVPDLLQQTLGVAVQNNGVPGATATAFLAGYGPNKPGVEHIAESPASIIYANFGINDSDDRGVETEATFRASLTEIVRAAKASGKQVVLETPNPVDGDHYTRLPRFAQITRDVAQAEGVALVDQYAYLSAMDWRPLMSDFAHPNQSGYSLKAEVAAVSIRVVIGR